MKHYRAMVNREDNYWLAEVPGMSGAHAYARTLTRLRDELANAIILADELPDDAQVLIDFEPDPSFADARLLTRAFQVAHQRHEIAEREARMHEELVETVEEMAGHYSVRDVAGALDITPGRVSQLTAAK